jgi:predicted PurR-regulated permease PerM
MFVFAVDLAGIAALRAQVLFLALIIGIMFTYGLDRYCVWLGRKGVTANIATVGADSRSYLFFW